MKLGLLTAIRPFQSLLQKTQNYISNLLTTWLTRRSRVRSGNVGRFITEHEDELVFNDILFSRERFFDDGGEVSWQPYGETPSYEDANPVPPYAQYDWDPLPNYDDVPITAMEVQEAVSQFSWVHFDLTRAPSVPTVPESGPDYSGIDLIGFFDIVREENSASTAQGWIGSAFPSLGSEDTCSCWMIQPASPLSPREIFAIKTLFEEYKTLGAGIFLDHDGAEGRVLSTVGVRRHWLIERIVACGCREIQYFSAHECHVHDGTFLHGHDMIHHATINGALSNIGKFEIMNIHVFDRSGIAIRAGIEDNHLPPCHHRALLRREVYTGPREVRNYVPLATRLATVNPEPRRKPLDNKWAEQFYGLIDIRVATYQNQFGSRQVGQDWHDVVDLVHNAWFEPYPDGSDASLVHTGEFDLPRCVKRRYKHLCSKLAVVAKTYGGKILADKAFDARNYQEWKEMNARRYELAEEMSNSEIAKSLPAHARLWLKTADAKHRLNRVVRTSLSDPARSVRMMKDFNQFFVNIIGGQSLKLPQAAIEKARANMEREARLRQIQIDGRDARQYVPGLGMAPPKSSLEG